MIVNNIITTIMKFKGKVNTVMKFTEECIIADRRQIYETMTEVMSFVQEWIKENPDKVRFMRTLKSLYKH